VVCHINHRESETRERQQLGSSVMALIKLKNSVTMNVLGRALKETGPVSLFWNEKNFWRSISDTHFQDFKIFPVLLAKEKDIH
jgi:hypothetical protein